MPCASSSLLCRMGTTLSNERTMLAWVRTVLAIVRSTFAFYGLTGTAGLGEESLSAVRYMMATVHARHYDWYEYYFISCVIIVVDGVGCYPHVRDRRDSLRERRRPASREGPPAVAQGRGEQKETPASIAQAIRRPVCRVPMTPFLLMVFTCTVMHSAATYRGMWCKGKDC